MTAIAVNAEGQVKAGGDTLAGEVDEPVVADPAGIQGAHVTGGHAAQRGRQPLCQREPGRVS